MKKNNALVFWAFLLMISGGALSIIASIQMIETKKEKQHIAIQQVEDSANESNDVVAAIMARRSIRKYKEQPVEREKMEVILDCGIHAPNAMNRQAWAVRVVDNPEFLNGITEVYLQELGEKGEKMKNEPGWRNMFRNAPTVVFIAAPDAPYGSVDVGLMAENMMLAAQSMGIGSCCLGGPIGFLRGESAAPYVERLKLPEGYLPSIVLAMGYADEEPEARPRDASKAFYVE